MVQIFHYVSSIVMNVYISQWSKHGTVYLLLVRLIKMVHYEYVIFGENENLHVT